MTLPVVELTDGWAVVVDVAVWAAWSTGVGYALHRRPVERFARDSWLTQVRPVERDGRTWERWVRIRAWKDRLPEAGALFAGGFDKRRLRSAGPAELERFVAETRRAELTHWWVMAAAPAFVLWNPPWLAGVMVAYGVVANLPCLLTQRYNRARLERVLDRARRRTTS